MADNLLPIQFPVRANDRIVRMPVASRDWNRWSKRRGDIGQEYRHQFCPRVDPELFVQVSDVLVKCVPTHSNLPCRFTLRPSKQQVSECLSLPSWKMDLLDNHHRRWRWFPSQHRSNTRKRQINLADRISVKLTLIQKLLEVIRKIGWGECVRHDGSIGKKPAESLSPAFGLPGNDERNHAVCRPRWKNSITSCIHPQLPHSGRSLIGNCGHRRSRISSGDTGGMSESAEHDSSMPAVKHNFLPCVILKRLATRSVQY